MVEQAAASIEAKDTVDYKELSFGEDLGKGSGGKVRVATWKKIGKKVAVKEYHGSRFSDGTARDEWLLNRVLKPHPLIMASLGTFSKPHLGMILELMEGAKAVGGSPSLDTCTRDAPPAQPYSWQMVLQVAQTICTACRHLHEQNITHGDVYLHNTLVDPNGSVKLSDFGAGYAYPKKLKTQIEGLEVRSFGWLVDDLCRYSSEDAKKAKCWPKMGDIIARCTKSGSPSSLPTFKKLEAELTAIAPV
eukprot:CAMPEP_0167779452 /NCGR_PEP_ID=MMETSP0111_2-20121227/4810_1 /TAXON_ID=91324 /ORGANISM="Lotharella globosa, Strain CCCM811" /LENGTH=246 /DNA_ID=CAMNT_0007669855 /DNA_START=525 /DNA_END=1265 /DNA_ORIENTATION=+